MQAEKKLKILLFSFLLSLIALSIFIIYTQKKNIQTFASMLKPRPEKFTELYLEDHTMLPKSPVKDTPYDFRFTIHNLEYESVRYPYTVSIESDGVNQVLDSGAVVLKHDEYKTILESFKLITDVKRVKVKVELTDKKQSIHFWMGEN